MQSVNVLPVFVSQDTDLKVKESSGASADSNKDSDFSSLVEQHLPDESKAMSRKDSAASEQDSAATHGKTMPSNGKGDEDKGNNRQESDSKQLLDVTNTQKNLPTEEILNQESEADKKASTNKEALVESEQFISLLYNSDQTLASQGKSTSSVRSEGDINALDAKRNKSKTVENVLAVESVKSGLTSEHKLKAFSKDELLASTQLQNSNALATQSGSQALKDYQLSLQSKSDVIKNESITSQQLMNTQLTNTQLQGKITEVATGVSLASKGQLTEQVGSGLYQQPVEPIDKASLNGNTLLNSTTELVAKDGVNPSVANVLVKPQGDIDAELAAQANEEGVISSTKAIDYSAVTLQPNKNDLEKSQLSSTNVDKVAAERNPQATIENIPKEQFVATQEKQPPMTSAQLQALQQVQAQQKLQSMTSEQHAIESSAEEFIDPELLIEAQPIELGVKKTSKGIDTMVMRSVSELQAQTVQATQTKQNNEAYLDHQVSEVLNHNVASDTAQIQKNNIQLQQETVSIFRKDFADAVKDKVMITINQKLQQFDITLDPPEFGNMQVRVNLQGEQASVNFVVQNQQAKDALEQNMHKLRDMLSEQGVDVGGANVEQQNQQQNDDEQNLQQNKGNSAALTNGSQKDDHNVEHVLSAQLLDSSATGVDYYA